MPFRYVSVNHAEPGGCTQVVSRSVNLFTLPKKNLQGGLGPQPTRVSGRRSSYSGPKARSGPTKRDPAWSIASDNPVGRLRHLGPTVRLRDPALLGPSLGSARPSRASVARPHPSAAIAVRGFVAEPSVPRNLADAWHSGPATGVVRVTNAVPRILVVGHRPASRQRGSRTIRAKVARIRNPALTVPRKVPATLDFPARRRPCGTGSSCMRRPVRAARICISRFHP